MSLSHKRYQRLRLVNLARRFAPGMLLMTACLLSPAAFADGAADLQQQLFASADTQELDLKTNEVLFIGNVEIKQGSIRIYADRLEVLRTADGSAVERMIAYGKPARYSQRMEDGTPVEARGNRIDYLMSQNTLLLEGNAQLSQETNLIKGQRIRYDLAKEQLTAESNGQEDRVTTIFLPPKQTDNNKDKEQ